MVNFAASQTQMPIYAYKCASCGFAKDVLQKLSDPPLSVCLQCAEPQFSKQVTAAGFQLKGSGWYVTDFRGGDKPKADAVSSTSESGAANSTAGEGSRATSSSSADSSGEGTLGQASPASSTSTPSSATSSGSSGGSNGSAGSTGSTSTSSTSTSNTNSSTSSSTTSGSSAPKSSS